MKEIIFATQNKGKLKEVRKIFEGSRFLISSLLDHENVPEIIEDKDTFMENALLKANVIFGHFKIPVIADDSGLAVEQLNQAPGVFSARYAGENASDEDNNKKLLDELKIYSEPHTAKFICAAVFFDGINIINTYGEVNGRIISEAKGKNGFGYDPLFIPDGYNVTMGELDIAAKNKISHRSKAFIKMRNLLEQLMERQ